MTDATPTVEASPALEPGDGRRVPRAPGFAGRLVASWTAAGGILGGGVLTAFLTTTGRLSANGLLMSSVVLFLFGTGAGLLHGAVLGSLGRPIGTTFAQARRSIGLGVLYLIPGLGVSLVVALWVSQTVVVPFQGRPGPTVALAIAWLVAAATLAWAAVLGGRALVNAYRRWPDPVVGTALVGIAFLSLVVIFLADRPAIWGTRLRVAGTGAFLLAAGATVWISGPVVSLPLILWRKLAEPRPLAIPVPSLGVGVRGAGAGVAAGLALGLFVLWLSPWVPAVVGERSVGTLVALPLARAVIDELLLRLLVVSGTVWALTRWHPLHREEAVVVGIVLGAVAQVLIHLPALLAVGLPSTALVWGAGAAGLFVPGLVFGALFAWGGLPASVAGHAVARILVGLLA